MQARPEFQTVGGDLATTTVAQLLAEAHSSAATGSLIFETPERRLSAVRFVEGLVVQANGFWQSTALERGALAMFLPPELVALVDQHAARYAVDLFTAVEQLSLLPAESQRVAREALLTRHVEKLSEISLTGHYRFRPGNERLKGAPCLEPGLVPYGLVVSALLADPRAPAEPCAREFGTQVLLVAPGRLNELRALLTGPARAVVESLARGGRTLFELEGLNLVATGTLCAIVYGLWLSGQIFAGPPRTSSSSAPPISANAAAVKEQTLEAKVMEAWAVAEADPSRIAKVSAFAAKAVAVFPNNGRLRFYLARLRRKENRLEEARAEFERVLELEPHNADARRELASLKDRLSAAPSRRLFGKG